MQVLVRDRSQGKTTELIKWFLNGKEIDRYPVWSRVIVVSQYSQVARVANDVRRHIMEQGWSPCSRMRVHTHRGNNDHMQMITAICKGIWSLSELQHNLRGARGFEWGLDDADEFLRQGARESIWYPPSVITITGEAVDSFRD